MVNTKLATLKDATLKRSDVKHLENPPKKSLPILLHTW
jgi:hypothetical protein